jgi:NDP-sugar pyrophosphorylase family protein
MGGSTALAFSGIHLLEASVLDRLTETGKFSIIDSYLRLAADTRICAYRHDAQWWLDVGKPEALALAEAHLRRSS